MNQNTKSKKSFFFSKSSVILFLILSILIGGYLLFQELIFIKKQNIHITKELIKLKDSIPQLNELQINAVKIKKELQEATKDSRKIETILKKAANNYELSKSIKTFINKIEKISKQPESWTNNIEINNLQVLLQNEIETISPLVGELYYSQIFNASWSLEAIKLLSQQIEYNEDALYELVLSYENILNIKPVSSAKILVKNLEINILKYQNELNKILHNKAVCNAKKALVTGENLNEVIIDLENLDSKENTDLLEKLQKILFLNQLKEKYVNILKYTKKTENKKAKNKLIFCINQLNNLQTIIISQKLDGKEGFTQLFNDINKQLEKIQFNLTKINVAESKILRGRYQKQALQNIKEFKENWNYSKNLEKVNLFVKNTKLKVYVPKIFEDFPLARNYLTTHILKNDYLTNYNDAFFKAVWDKMGGLNYKYNDTLAAAITLLATKKYLMPIDRNLLAPAVLSIYQEQWDSTWKILKDKKNIERDKESFAVKAAEIEAETNKLQIEDMKK